MKNGDQLPGPCIGRRRSTTNCNKSMFYYSGTLSTHFGPLEQDELQENFLVSISRVNIRDSAALK
jgi:hypothetical protein